VLGLPANGPLAHGKASASDGRLTVDYQRYAPDGAPPACESRWPGSGRAQSGYSSRLTSTVSTTEAMTENSTMSRQPSPPPSGRISTFPKRMHPE
jgi:hypothetical protein